MKKLVSIILILSVLPFEIMAQEEHEEAELSLEMAAFKDYCIAAANAAAECDVDTLALCIENWEPGEYDANGIEINPEKITYNDVEIYFTEFSDLNCVDTLSENIIGMHFGFTPQSVDNWITNQCEPVMIADAHQLRDGQKNLEYTVRVLKANSKATYSTRGGDDIEMFVVAENGGSVNFSIHAVETSKNGDKVTDLADNSGSQWAQLSWSMYHSGTIEFTVENTTDREISFIIVKNL